MLAVHYLTIRLQMRPRTALRGQSSSKRSEQRTLVTRGRSSDAMRYIGAIMQAAYEH